MGMNGRISDFRRRKIQLYSRYLPLDDPTFFRGGNLDDLTYLKILERVEALSPPGTALWVGAERKLADLGLLGHVIASAASLSETLSIWNRHARMAGEFAELSSDVYRKPSGGSWTLTFKASRLLSPALSRFTLEELATTFFSLAGEVLREDFSAFRTEFSHPMVPSVDYDSLLPGPVRFNCPTTRISGPAYFLDLPQRASDPEAFGLLISGLAGDRHTIENDDLPGRLRDYFSATFGRPPNLSDAARTLGMSQRTIDRKLCELGTGYSSILAEFRFEWARHLLRSQSMSVAQIGHMLGYGNENSFRRAFRTWADCSIATWRRSAT